MRHINHRPLTLAIAGAALMAAMPGQAQTADAFPPRLLKGQTEQETRLNRAPLNKHVQLGTKVFGVTQIDYNKARNFVNYYENAYQLERLNKIYDDNDAVEHPDLYMVNAGAYNPSDGYYYAYKVEYYTIGITYSYQWLRVNPADGSWEVVTTLEHSAHNGTPLYDMAYSPYDDEMYGLVQNVDGQIKSRIGIVDMSNSKVSDLIQLDEYYFAMSFDYDGNLYAIRWDLDSEQKVIGTKLDVFDMDFKVVKSMPILVEGAPYISYYQHGLDFDYTTGDLLWSATDYNGYQKMVRINPETGATTNYGGIGYSEIMVGLHVPYTTAAHREAPARVTDATFTIDPAGANNVTLTWTNPSTRWNRTALNDLTSVRIYRDSHDGTPVGTVDASGKEGQSMQFTDKDAPQGVHKYYIIPVNAKGEGVETYIEAYVGRDVPGQVNDITLSTTDKGRSVVITWTPPTTGASEGWFDKTITYDIERLPDHVKVASGLDATTYTDANIEESQFYSYIITPVTSDGRGEPRTSEGILAGNSLKVPFSTDFGTATEADRFLSFDSYGTNSMFNYSYNTANPGTMAMFYSYQTNNNATLSSPPMNLTKGKTYRVDWHFTLARFGYTFEDTYNHFKIMGGTGPNAQEMTTVLADHEKFLSVQQPEDFVITTYFDSPVDGDYYVGFNVATNDADRKDDWIYVTGFSITESPADDLMVETFNAPKIVSSGIDNFFDVEVYNNGVNTQDKYSVEVGILRLDGVFEPFASTSNVPSIASHTSKTVRVIGKTDKYGIQDIAARVVLESDGNRSNDISDVTTAKVEAGPAYNYHADFEESTHTDSGLPMTLYYSNSLTQAIYTADMLGIDAKQTKIGALAWEYTAARDISDVNLQVYLNTTDKTTYNANRAAYIANGDLVYDGKVNFTKDNGEGIFNWLMVNFEEKAFTIQPDQNLVVTVFMQQGSTHTDFPVLFHVFNSGNAGPNASDGLTHTLSSRDVPSLAQPGKIFPFSEIPTLHVGVTTDWNGVEEIATGATDMNAVVTGNIVRFSGDVAFAAISDMAGRTMRASVVSDGTAMALDLSAGIYILTMQDAAGNTRTMKFAVR